MTTSRRIYTQDYHHFEHAHISLLSQQFRPCNICVMCHNLLTIQVIYSTGEKVPHWAELDDNLLVCCMNIPIVSDCINHLKW